MAVDTEGRRLSPTPPRRRSSKASRSDAHHRRSPSASPASIPSTQSHDDSSRRHKTSRHARERESSTSRDAHSRRQLAEEDRRRVRKRTRANPRDSGHGSPKKECNTSEQHTRCTSSYDSEAAERHVKGRMSKQRRREGSHDASNGRRRHSRSSDRLRRDSSGAGLERRPRAGDERSRSRDRLEDLRRKHSRSASFSPRHDYRRKYHATEYRRHENRRIEPQYASRYENGRHQPGRHYYRPSDSYQPKPRDSQYEREREREHGRDRRRGSPSRTVYRREEVPEKPSQAVDREVLHSPEAVKAGKPKVKKPTVSLSFDEEIAVAERQAIKKKDVSELTAQRMTEERSRTPAQKLGLSSNHQTLSNVRYMPSNGKALAVVDNEADDLAGEVEAQIMCVARAAASQSRGPKAEMEDFHSIVATLHRGRGTLVEDIASAAFYGVYDGHCGGMAAKLAADQLHDFLAEDKAAFEKGARESFEERKERAAEACKEAYAKMEALILKRLMEEGKRTDGAAVVTAVLARNCLFLANCGDCRAVLATQTDEGICSVRLSMDHKPNLPEEELRIKRAGGRVEFYGVFRVAHPTIPSRLAVSRSLGDPPYKQKQPTSSELLVSPVPFTHARQLTRADLFLILASDGLWDSMTDAEAVRIVADVFRRSLGGNPSGWRPTDLTVKEASDALVSTAISRGTIDNTTALVVCMQWQP